MREMLRDLLLIGTSAALLWLFVLIHTHGRVCIYEDILWVKWAETIMLVAIIGFGIERLMYHLRQK